MARYYNVVYSEYVLACIFNWSAESYVIISMSLGYKQRKFHYVIDMLGFFVGYLLSFIRIWVHYCI